MSTEYRTGIPSHAHIKAAERLGLLWHANGGFYHRFRGDVDQIEVQFALAADVISNGNWDPLDRDIHNLSYRPIRPDGTSVDWETLDAEVARVAGAAGTVQPQGFRTDLWQVLSSHLASGNGCRLSDTVRLDWRGFRVQNRFFSYCLRGALRV